MEKRENDRLIGVWRHTQGGWEIKYQLDGKKHSEYRKDEHEARLRAEYWKATLESAPPEEEHMVIAWEKRLRKLADLLVSNPDNRDLAMACRSLAAAATAAFRAAKYLPAPRQSTSPDSAPVSGDVSDMTTEEMEAVLGQSSNTPDSVK